VSAAWVLPAATPSPSTSTQTPRSVDPDSVTPGVAGFLVVFVLAIVTWLLMRNMTARLRRMRFREQERLRTEGGIDGSAGPGAGPGGSGPGEGAGRG
jgi:hypothetical protein